MLFVGDSILHKCPRDGLFDLMPYDIVFHTRNGDNVSTAMKKLLKDPPPPIRGQIEYAAYAAVVISMGFNEFAPFVPDLFEEYARLIAKHHPNAALLVLEHTTAQTSKRVGDASWLRKAWLEVKRRMDESPTEAGAGLLRIISATNVGVEASHFMPSDGYHLTESGYHMLARDVHAALVQIFPPAESMDTSSDDVTTAGDFECVENGGGYELDNDLDDEFGDVSSDVSSDSDDPLRFMLI